MRKFVASVILGSLLFTSVMPAFADETDKATDIRRQILELTKELNEVSQTEGDITYKALETDESFGGIACEITNNTEYNLYMRPSFVARNEDGDIQFAYITNDQIIGAGNTTVAYIKTSNSDMLKEDGITMEWGARTEHTDYSVYNDIVSVEATASKHKIILLPSSEDPDTNIWMRAIVVFMKNGKVVDVNDERITSTDESEEMVIDYEGSTDYDDYAVYYTAYIP